MKVLVVGGGGREHALAWKIRQSPLVEKVFCAPGNAGIEREAECLPVAADDLPGLARLVKERGIELAVIGPEAPATLGLADRLQEQGVTVFGVSQAAAELEGSKIFAKELMRDAGIPTADFRVFNDAGQARAYVRGAARPQVVKADGLAAGKGVIVCRGREDAEAAVAEVMEKKAFGAAGNRLVVEDRLEGEEASFLAFTDGETVIPLASS